MGEGIIEATVTRWLKKLGDTVELDEPIVEIATDKVDSEIPALGFGILTEIIANEGDVVSVGSCIGIISTDGNSATVKSAVAEKKEVQPVAEATEIITKISEPTEIINSSNDLKFISPLVRSIAIKENIDLNEINKIKGTGKDGRVTKSDFLLYLNEKKNISPDLSKENNQSNEIIEMDRMRRIIADHMVMSVKISPHVTSFAEADVTELVKWREKNKKPFEQRENKKLTYTPIFIEILAKAIAEFPMINSSVDGYKIILKKNINIGMAVALPSGNLIVPVIKNADTKSLLSIVKDVNDISERARSNKLNPDEIQGATFTITNLGSFGSLAGTPIINQPQVAIIAVGAIKKRPVVIESELGDSIGIRHIMIISLAYDHRVIDGALGGKFLNRFIEFLEQFDSNTKI